MNIKRNIQEKQNNELQLLLMSVFTSSINCFFCTGFSTKRPTDHSSLSTESSNVSSTESSNVSSTESSNVSSNESTKTTKGSRGSRLASFYAFTLASFYTLAVAFGHIFHHL